MKTQREPFLINPPKGFLRGLGKIGSRHRPVAYRTEKGWETSRIARKAKRGVRMNPLGETLVTVGGNPMLAFANYRRRRRRRRSNRYVYTMNKRRRRGRRSRRRNPAAVGLRGAMQFQKWIPWGITAGLSGIVTGMAPGMFGVINPWAKLGVQVGSAFIGGGMVRQMVGRDQGNAWMLGGITVIMVDFLRTWLPRMGVALPLGAYEDYAPSTDEAGLLYGYPETAGVGAFTDENLQGVGAYPEEVEGVGYFPYPYGGQH